MTNYEDVQCLIDMEYEQRLKLREDAARIKKLYLTLVEGYHMQLTWYDFEQAYADSVQNQKRG